MATVDVVAERRWGLPEGTKTASLDLTITRPEIEWLYAMLGVGEQVALYAGAFPRPFDKLMYVVLGMQNQPALVAQFQLGDQFKQQNPQGIGPNEVLQYLSRRYPESQYSPDQTKFVVAKGNKVHGLIARASDNTVVIQRGGNAGDTKLAADSPITGLNDLLGDFSLLVQRYVGAVWKTSQDTAQNQMQMVLSTPDSPSAQAVGRYFATDSIITPRFFTQPRQLLYENIGGYLRAKNMIRSLVVDATDPKRSIRYGTQPYVNKWALVWGDEGAGKSLLPKALYHGMDRVLNADYYTEMAQIKEKIEGVDEAKIAAKKDQDQARLAELKVLRQVLEQQRLALQGRRVGIEYQRLMLGQLFAEYDIRASDVLQTVFNHVREREKNGGHTIVHVDGMEELVAPFRRPNGGMVILPSEAEYRHTTGRINQAVNVIREFGAVLGPHSRSTIVYGESRITKESLPGLVTGPFRRNEYLGPLTRDEVAEVLRVVIMTTQANAAKGVKGESIGSDPFVPGILDRLGLIAPNGIGLLGGDIQKAMVYLANKHKAEDTDGFREYTDRELADELAAKRAEKNVEGGPKGTIGFVTTNIRGKNGN